MGDSHQLLQCAHDVLRQLARSEDARKSFEGECAVARARVEQQVASRAPARCRRVPRVRDARGSVLVRPGSVLGSHSSCPTSWHMRVQHMQSIRVCIMKFGNAAHEQTETISQLKEDLISAQAQLRTALDVAKEERVSKLKPQAPAHHST